MWIPPENHRAVGDALAELRNRESMTQAALAQKLGKPQSFVSSYENGQRRIDILEFLVIVEALNGAPELIFKDILRRRAEG